MEEINRHDVSNLKKITINTMVGVIVSVLMVHIVFLFVIDRPINLIEILPVNLVLFAISYGGSAYSFNKQYEIFSKILLLKSIAWASIYFAIFVFIVLVIFFNLVNEQVNLQNITVASFIPGFVFFIGALIRMNIHSNIFVTIIAIVCMCVLVFSYII